MAARRIPPPLLKVMLQLTLLLAAATLGGNDWPTFRGDAARTPPVGIRSAVPGALPAPVRLFVSAIRVRVFWPRSGAIKARFALL